jgi:hypothetical protein
MYVSTERGREARPGGPSCHPSPKISTIGFVGPFAPKFKRAERTAPVGQAQ